MLTDINTGDGAKNTGASGAGSVQLRHSFYMLVLPACYQ